MAHTTWSQLREQRTREPGFAEAYGQAELAYELGRRVRELRQARGLSQRQLAVLIGTSQPAIARLEMGGTNPRMNTLARLSAALGAELVVALREPAIA
ncbi:MAG: helix-turn-helix transcriptional regulator [Dehalococcoidia bacterium]